GDDLSRHLLPVGGRAGGSPHHGLRRRCRRHHARRAGGPALFRAAAGVPPALPLPPVALLSHSGAPRPGGGAPLGPGGGLMRPPAGNNWLQTAPPPRGGRLYTDRAPSSVEGP